MIIRPIIELIMCFRECRKHWKRVRTTNLMERVNRELKRRTRVVGVFSNEESLLRLVGSILMDITRSGLPAEGI